MSSGGSTKPLRVIAITEGEITPEETPYVVKVFKNNHVVQGNSIAKEFICNTLAEEFDLSVPETGLINLNEEPFAELLESSEQAFLKERHQGPTFASRLLEASLVNPALRNYVFKTYDMATLFAFDCMIINTDRGGHHNKPNLLVDDDGFILIDHELTLGFIDGDDEQAHEKYLQLIKDKQWPPFFAKHLFYDELKSYRGPSKKSLFDTFENSLAGISLSRIEQSLDDLRKNGIAVGRGEQIIDYLRTLKQQPDKFKNLLLGLIS